MAQDDVPTSGRRWPIIVIAVLAFGFAAIAYFTLTGANTGQNIATANPPATTQQQASTQ